jgi:hypothetical protein
LVQDGGRERAPLVRDVNQQKFGAVPEKPKRLPKNR